MHQERQRVWKHIQPAQSLVIMALVLPVVIALVMGCVEVSLRYLELAQVEDALRQSTRSAVQTFDYARFAQGNSEVVSARAQAVAERSLTINLAGVHGLEESPETTASSRVTWTILPSGGTCFADAPAQTVHFTRPAVCAMAQPTLAPLLGWAAWQPRIYAAETLDQ